MEMRPQQQPDPNAPTSGRGMHRDIKSVQVNSAAVGTEIGDFLEQMRGRSPQEMLGLVAQSDLIRSTIVATVGCVVLILALTIIPHVLREEAPAKADVKAETPATQTPPDVAKTPDPVAVGKTDTGNTKTGDNPDKVAKTLGIGDVKTGSPDLDPFKNSDDDLLKD